MVTVNEKEKRELAESAVEARKRAYVPYSHFSVGAALLTDEGETVTGCNVENASYPAGLCAERVAIFSAVAAGKRHFQGIAVTGGKEGEEPADFCMPCGMCLQVMSEFAGPDFEILIVKNEEEIQEYCLRDFLPHTFTSLGEITR